MSRLDANIDYYERVADYYDQEAALFEQHYQNNPILQRIRHDFRRITERYPFQSALEIGCGPGIDLFYFADKYPQRKFRGIDVSPAMVEHARAKLISLAHVDVRADIGAADDIAMVYPDEKFDLIYCYFGALNTVPDLKRTATNMVKQLTHNGVMILTFVNRWYWFDILWYMLRLRWQKAWARATNNWRGYAPNRPLQSYCRSTHEIIRAFSPHANCIFRKGYSILYPAWYRHRFIPIEGTLGNILWRLDSLVNYTPFRDLGEYNLYVFQLGR